MATSNLYFIGANSIDSATMWASTTASGFDVNNTTMDQKSKVHRSTATSVVIAGSWTTAQTLGALGLAFTNLIEGSVVQIVLYSDTAGTIIIYDSGVQTVDFAYDAPVGFDTIGLPAFAFGGGTYFSHLFDQEYSAKKVQISMSSGSNPDGYIEISRIITGAAFVPSIGAGYGARVNHDDKSAISLTDSGDTAASRGTINKIISFPIGAMTPADRQGLMSLIHSRGLSGPVWASMSEATANIEERQSYMIYGRFDQLPGVTISQMDLYNSSIDLREI